jgi:hypothetical protein
MADIPTPFQLGGLAQNPSFATLESLIGHYARWIPVPYVRGLIEAEKEIFVVRKDCSLRETQAQFLRRCENALARAMNDAQAGRAAWDWSHVPPSD